MNYSISYEYFSDTQRAEIPYDVDIDVGIW